MSTQVTNARQVTTWSSIEASLDTLDGCRPRGITYMAGNKKVTSSPTVLDSLRGYEPRIGVGGQHAFQHTLERHRVSTGAVVVEELAGARPAVVGHGRIVITVLAVKLHAEGGNAHPGSLCCVALGLFDL